MIYYQAINTELNNWLRWGRGHSFLFVATDDEVKHWLLSSLTPQYAPCLMVTSSMVKEDKVFTEIPVYGQMNELDEFMHTVRNTGKFWIWSQQLSRDLRIEPHTQIAAQLSLNGLILIQHGRKLRDLTTPDQEIAIAPSSLGIVDRVQNVKSGEVRHYDAYLHIFTVLKRELKKRLIYTSILRWRTGEEKEVIGAGVPLWTEAVLRDAPGAAIDFI